MLHQANAAQFIVFSIDVRKQVSTYLQMLWPLKDANCVSAIRDDVGPKARTQFSLTCIIHILRFQWRTPWQMGNLSEKPTLPRLCSPKWYSSKLSVCPRLVQYSRVVVYHRMLTHVKPACDTIHWKVFGCPSTLTAVVGT